jgi:hypothetical protein
VEFGELTKDPQVIVDLLGKVDSWIENDSFARHTGPFSQKELLAKESKHLLDCVLVKDMGVRNLWRSDGMDNQQRGAGLRADLRVPIVGQGAEIIEQMPAGPECDRGNFGPPSINREQRRENLLSVPRRDVPPDFIESLQEGKEPPQFLFWGDRGSIGSGAFAAHIHDVRSLGNELTRLLQSPLGIDPPVTAKGVVVDIDDADDQRPSRKADASITGKQFHLVLGSILFQAWSLLQQP